MSYTIFILKTKSTKTNRMPARWGIPSAGVRGNVCWTAPPLFGGGVGPTTATQMAPNDTAYKRWSCHSGFKLLCKLCRTSPPPAMGVRFTVFWACRPCGPAGWLALLLTKAGDVETNPGPTTLNKKVWICDICHKQIHVRKQISIRCNRIEHWVHLRCANIRQAQYTDTWTCHLHR